jgi:hypothetical protein
MRETHAGYFFPFACESALPAPDFDMRLVRPSRSVFEAFFAAAEDVFLFVLRCERALPAALFDFADVLRLLMVHDAFDAALERVCLATRTSR